MKILPLSALLLALGGCAALEPVHFYTLDLEQTRLCRGATGYCHNLELIGPSYNEHRIAEAYGISAGSRGWSVADLTRLMLTPPGQPYEAEPLGNGLYRLPANQATDAVFQLLELEENQIYGGGDVRND